MPPYKIHNTGTYTLSNLMIDQISYTPSPEAITNSVLKSRERFLQFDACPNKIVRQRRVIVSCEFLV